jgi:uncharacterized protein (DUF58 family)
MRVLVIFSYFYGIAALIIAVLFSPANFSIIPIIILALSLFLWRRIISPVIRILTQYFLFLAIALLYSVVIPEYLAPLVSLPLLVLITDSLNKGAQNLGLYRPSLKRRPTTLFIIQWVVIFAVLTLAALLINVTLLISIAVLFLYLICLTSIILMQHSGKPIKAENTMLRILAGKTEEIEIKVAPMTTSGVTIFFETEYEWVKIKNRRLYFKDRQLPLQLSITPPLAGPALIKLKGYAIDRFGLFQTSFDIEPIELVVIPRARYASWLARRYMSGTRQGNLPLISSTAVTKALQGLRHGIEYYGNRIYQAGDSLKNINWKASVKYDELISKEFDEFRGQPAVILINLIAGNDDELDRLAYNILITAISLGQANIPASLAVYDKETVVLITPALSSVQLVSNALRIVKKLSVHKNPLKYLNTPDVLRLRSNINRLNNSIGNQVSRKLSALLKLEYEALNSGANSNPCTKALFQAKAKINEQFNVVVLSLYNHDAEALAFNTYMLTRKGSFVINIM